MLSVQTRKIKFLLKLILNSFIYQETSVLPLSDEERRVVLRKLEEFNFPGLTANGVLTAVTSYRAGEPAVSSGPPTFSDIGRSTPQKIPEAPAQKILVLTLRVRHFSLLIVSVIDF